MIEPASPPEERYAMNEDTTVLPFRQSGKIEDPVTEISREGARRMLACLTKDKKAMLAFFDFPAGHRGHRRTSNPIESPRAITRSDGGHAFDCDSSAQSSAHQGHAVAENLETDSVHPHSGCIKEIAPPETGKPVSKSHRRTKINRRRPSHRRRQNTRRLILRVTQIQAQLLPDRPCARTCGSAPMEALPEIVLAALGRVPANV